ncbi:MAG: GDSL-type esterase/lipase family protein [Microbacteriaceae bacterium]
MDEQVLTPRSIRPAADRTTRTTRLRGSMSPVTRIEDHVPGDGSERLVIPLGDSITQGQIGADWVGSLAERYAGDDTAFVNAGVNGNLAWNVLQRLDAVIAARPAIVTLLIGTNDVSGARSAEMAALYRQQQGIPRAPTADWFEENVAAILDRMRFETDARIALLEIPLAGERLDEEPNLTVLAYNGILHRLAADRGIEVLPVFDRLAAVLPAGATPPPFAIDIAQTIQAATDHARGRSWDEISASNGLSLLIDQVHLNDRAGGIVADLVAGFLDEA